MTAPDVRTAAQVEADSRFPEMPFAPENEALSEAFTEGAVWGAALVTPTRGQIAEALYSSHPRATTRPWADTPRFTRQLYYDDADVVLALLTELATGDV